MENRGILFLVRQKSFLFETASILERDIMNPNRS